MTPQALHLAFAQTLGGTVSPDGKAPRPNVSPPFRFERVGGVMVVSASGHGVMVVRIAGGGHGCNR